MAAALLPLAALTSSLAAQQPGRISSVAGVAFDSIRGRPMAGAQIAVVGTTLLAVAGADGHFQFDSVPSGKLRLVAAHPFLDSLGIQLMTPELTVGPGQQIVVDVVTPSAKALVKQFCPAAWLTRGPAALFGRVRNADTGAPIDKAHVSLVWTETEFGGLSKVPKVRVGTTAADGTYRICGLPGTLDGKVQVDYAGLKSGDVPVTLDKDVLEVRSLSLASAAPAVVAAAGDTTPPGPRRALTVAKLSGKVLSVTGSPVTAARVQVEGTTHSADTRADGTFELDSLPSGSQVVIARRIGYNPVEKSVELSSGRAAQIVLQFDQAVALLPTVTTEATTETGLDAVGFNARKKSGMGFYMDPSFISHLGATRVTDVLRAAPGISVVESGYDTYVYDTRTQGQGCVTYIVDGSPWVSMNPGDINSFLQAGNIGAIEVYHGSETPPQFVTPGQGGCGTIVIWSKWRIEQMKKKSK